MESNISATSRLRGFLMQKRGPKSSDTVLLTFPDRYNFSYMRKFYSKNDHLQYFSTMLKAVKRLLITEIKTGVVLYSICVKIA
jgi:hypothetical protein